MTPAVYAPHDAFVAPARLFPQVGRLVIGVLAIEFLFALGLTAVGAVLEWLDPRLARTVFFGDSAAGLLIQLGSFALLWLAISMVLRRQHDRTLASALGPVDTLLPLIARCFLASAAVILVVEVCPPWWDASAIVVQRPAAQWLLTLPLALTVLLIQTGAEEAFYRGYLQQQLAARFDRPWIWLTLPNLMFAIAHWDNGATQTESWQYVIWAFCFGLAASDLTARSGTLAPAIGLHLANNAYAFLLYGHQGGPDSGLALFLFPGDAIPPTEPGPDAAAASGPVLTLVLVSDIAMIWLGWLAARIALRR